MSRWIIFFIFIACVEIYAFQAFKTVFKSKWIHTSYIIISALVFVYVVYQLMQLDRSVGQTQTSLWTFAVLLIIFVPKLIIALLLVVEDIFRLFAGTYHKVAGSNANDDFLPKRRDFVSKIALGIAAIPFFSLLYGVTYGKYNFKVIKQPVGFADLPDSFDGFRIMQLSDIHCGSFDDPEKIEYAIDLINEQDFDVLLFTGDIVNTHAREMDPWIETFKRIKKPAFGKFSVLGNHDYGEYVNWSSTAEKDANFNAIKEIHPQIGFQLLNNESVTLTKGNDKISIVGVENWGYNFKKAGDISTASQGLSTEDFKVVLTHDPSHWEYELKNHTKNFQLTLSGHTHGMQFGIEIPGFLKWSPAQFIYKQWAGLYDNAKRFVYVNRGFGFHAYPGRVGIMPEITILELKKIDSNT